MDNVLPIVIVCGVGIVASIVYILFQCVKAMRAHPRFRHKHEFEIEEDVLTIKLDRRKKKNK